MRLLRGLVGALLIPACASGVTVPEAGVPLTAEAPRPAPPAAGPSESDASVDTRAVVKVGGRRVELRAWCRVDVWTTLDRTTLVPFTIRESWGRLGERKPRRLAQVIDQLVGGVVLRVRPRRDGALDFVLEVSQGTVDGPVEAGTFHGETVELDKARRHGYRFAGRAPAGHAGLIAHWPGAVACWLGEDEPALPADGLVVGAGAQAETFLETWAPVEPVLVQADGVERADFRQVAKRSAAGLRPDGRGWYKTYGARFHLGGDADRVRFGPVRAGPEDAR